VVFGMEPAAVGASAAMEAGLAAESAGVASATLGALVPAPMAADADSVKFSALVTSVADSRIYWSRRAASYRSRRRRWS
jgi:hypothetical protein